MEITRVYIKNMRATALAWWRCCSLEYKRNLMDSHLNDSRFKNALTVPSIIIERIFIKWLEADRNNTIKSDKKIVCDECGFSSADQRRFDYSKETLCNFCY